MSDANPLRDFCDLLNSRYFTGVGSVGNQVTHLVIAGRNFEVLNESRKSARSLSLASRNPIVAEAGNKYFIYSQCMGVSRLTDPFKAKTEHRVVSLPAAIKDLEDNLHLFTRKDYVELDGTPHHELNGFCRQRRESTFDALADVTPKERAPENTVSRDFIRVLKKILRRPEIEALRVHRNKILAHNASEEYLGRAAKHLSSNEFFGDSGAKISLRMVRRAQLALCLSCAFLEQCILFKGSPAYISTAQYDVFEGLSDGWWDERQEDRVIAAYNSYSERRELWTRSPMRPICFLKNSWFPKN